MKDPHECSPLKSLTTLIILSDIMTRWLETATALCYSFERMDGYA